MIASKDEQYYDRLKKRRREIIRTLKHVQNEQCMVNENTDWIDKAAYESRCHLLNNLAEWYASETARINNALRRITEGRYGVCLSCREPIATDHLEKSPAAAFCVKCQKHKEELTEL